MLMDRVRTGLTGLGLVFVFTLVAAAMVDPVPAVQPTKEGAEPLAQLGVAPGSDKNDPADTFIPLYGFGNGPAASRPGMPMPLPGAGRSGEHPINGPDLAPAARPATIADRFTV